MQLNLLFAIVSLQKIVPLNFHVLSTKKYINLFLFSISCSHEQQTTENRGAAELGRGGGITG